MATRPPPLDENIHWRQAVSTRGVAFEIGTRQSGTGEVGAAIERRSRAIEQMPMDPIDIAVHWSVVGDRWNDTEGTVAAYITRYWLGENHYSLIWDWLLQFTAVQYGRYQFHDQSGDFYQVEVEWSLGDHYVRYNSPLPTILWVRFWPWALIPAADSTPPDPPSQPDSGQTNEEPM